MLCCSNRRRKKVVIFPIFSVFIQTLQTNVVNPVSQKLCPAMTRTDHRFEGKVVIVTGSSNGIGRETARLFAQEGAKVTITGRSEESLKKTFDLLIESGASFSNIVRILGNITEQKVQQQLINETVEKFGKIDVLVNNAGGSYEGSKGKIGFDQPPEAFDYTINFRILTLTQLAMPYLIASKGEVVMVSSNVALPFSMPHQPYYSVSKAALEQLTRSLAAIYILQGVRVNSVNPGLTHTTIANKQGMPEDMVAGFYQAIGSNRELIPIGRVGSPRDFAEFIAFLADRSRSEFIVGQCMVIDGGSSLLNPLLNVKP